VATADMGRKEEGAAVPQSRRTGTPSNTMWPGPKSTSVPSGVFIHLAVCHKRHGQKIGWGWVFPFWGPNRTQSRLGRGLPPYEVASYSIRPFGFYKNGPKIGGSVPFLGRVAGSPPNTMSQAEAYLCTKWHLDPFSRLTTIDVGQKLWAPPLFGEEGWVPI